MLCFHINEEEQKLAEKGYFVASDVIPVSTCEDLVSRLPSISGSGSRLLLADSRFQELSAELRSSVALAPLLRNMVAVQGIFFRKTSSHNWSLSLHEDKVFPIEGAGPWPSAGHKEGLPFVVVAKEYVSRFVAVRVALDSSADGDLRVLPGSHRDKSVGLSASIAIQVPRGGALVFRPTLLHGSDKLSASSTRRVLHFVYAPGYLPADYTWYQAF